MIVADGTRVARSFLKVGPPPPHNHDCPFGFALEHQPKVDRQDFQSVCRLKCGFGCDRGLLPLRFTAAFVTGAFQGAKVDPYTVPVWLLFLSKPSRVGQKGPSKPIGAESCAP